MFLKTLFERTTIIKGGENLYLEKAALYLLLSNLGGSHIFKEDGDGRLLSYDGNPKHLVYVTFSTIKEYCNEHDFECLPGTDYTTGIDILIVYKKKEP